MKYHAGELEVQKRAGVRQMSARVENAIRDFMPPVAQQFLEERAFAILAGTDKAGFVWASFLGSPTGKPGFLHTPDERTVRIDALPHPGDALAQRWRELTTGEEVPVGMLAIDPETRRRMRINGILELNSIAEKPGLILRVQQAYANCPKYIQARTLEPEAEVETDRETKPPIEAKYGHVLTKSQQEWISEADTFFIASVHTKDGLDGLADSADASHRGGMPGFVRVENETTLLFPDYSGNAMFNTLGNLAVNPSAGLLFVNFETGDTLQLSGKAEILWDAETISQFVGAERVVRFTLLRSVEVAGASLLHGGEVEYSPFNPN